MRILTFYFSLLFSFSVLAQKSEIEENKSIDLTNWKKQKTINKQRLFDLIAKKELKTCHTDSDESIYFDLNKQAKDGIEELYINDVIWFEKMKTGKWFIIFTGILAGNVDSFIVLEFGKEGINKYCRLQGLPVNLSTSFNKSTTTYNIISTQLTSEKITIYYNNTVTL